MSHYPGELSAGDTTRLKEWLNGHAQCNSHYFDDDLAGDSHLLIVTETYAPNLDISKQGYIPNRTPCGVCEHLRMRSTKDPRDPFRWVDTCDLLNVDVDPNTRYSACPLKGEQ